MNMFTPFIISASNAFLINMHSNKRQNVPSSMFNSFSFFFDILRAGLDSESSSSSWSSWPRFLFREEILPLSSAAGASVALIHFQPKSLPFFREAYILVFVVPWAVSNPFPRSEKVTFIEELPYLESCSPG